MTIGRPALRFGRSFPFLWVLILPLPMLMTLNLPGQSRSKAQARVRYGIASYYASRFSGKSTSSGEVFSNARMTAACNSLPLQSFVRVTNMHNHRSVIVRINDRMNDSNSRLIDLSQAAARKIGMIRRGIIRVRMVLLRSSWIESACLGLLESLALPLFCP